MNVVKLNGTVIPVAVDFHARAGDNIIVVNGVCLGLFTGEVEAPPPAKRPPVVKPKPPEPPVTLHSLRARILVFLKERPGAETADVLNALQLPAGTVNRERAKALLHRMADNGVLRKEHKDRLNTRLGTRFFLAEEPANNNREQAT